MSNPTDQIKFKLSRRFETKLRYCCLAWQSLLCYIVVARLDFKPCTTDLPNSIHKLKIYMYITIYILKANYKLPFIYMFCFRRKLFYSSKLNSSLKPSDAIVVLHLSQLNTAVAQNLQQALRPRFLQPCSIPQNSLE